MQCDSVDLIFIRFQLKKFTRCWDKFLTICHRAAPVAEAMVNIAFCCCLGFSKRVTHERGLRLVSEPVPQTLLCSIQIPHLFRYENWQHISINWKSSNP